MRLERGVGLSDTFPEEFALLASLLIELGQARLEGGPSPSDPQLVALRGRAAQAAEHLLRLPVWAPVRQEIDEHLLPLLVQVPALGYSNRVGLISAVFERLRNVGDHTSDPQVRGLTLRTYGYKFPRFGTSGIRGIWERDISRGRAEAVTQALCDYLGREGAPVAGHFVVGFDTRLHADRLAGWVSQVLLERGFDVQLSAAPLPTPVLNFWGTHVAADGLRGIVMCTASHNPPEWHGIKFTPTTGLPASTTITDWVGSHANRLLLSASLDAIPAPTSRPVPGQLSRFDARAAYTDWLLSPDRPLALDTVKIREWFHDKLVVVDEMHGAGAGYLRLALDRLGVPNVAVHGTPSPTFGRLSYPAPEPPHLSEAQEIVERLGAELGLAMDADADRFGVIDPGGHFVHPSEVVAVLADYLVNQRRLPGKVVRSLTCSIAVDDVLRSTRDPARTPAPAPDALPAYLRGPAQVVTRGKLTSLTDTPTFVTMVGIKYLMEAGRMDASYRVPAGAPSDFVLAGEESGGITTAGHVNDKDGVWANLVVLDAVAHYRRPFGAVWEELAKRSGREWHLGRVDLDGPDEVKRALVAHFLFNVAEVALPTPLAGLELGFVGGIPHDYVELRVLRSGSLVGRLIVRGSGTEPICRVYSEATDPAIREQLERWVVDSYDRLCAEFVASCDSAWRLVDLLFSTLPTPLTQRSVETVLARMASTNPTIRSAVAGELARLGGRYDTRKREVAHLWIPLLLRGSAVAGPPRGIEADKLRSAGGVIVDLEGSFGQNQDGAPLPAETIEWLASLLRSGHRLAVLLGGPDPRGDEVSRLWGRIKRAMTAKERAAAGRRWLAYSDGASRKFQITPGSGSVEETEFGRGVALDPTDAETLRARLVAVLDGLPRSPGRVRGKRPGVLSTPGGLWIRGVPREHHPELLAQGQRLLDDLGWEKRYEIRATGAGLVRVARARGTHERSVRDAISAWGAPANLVMVIGEGFYRGGNREPVAKIEGIRCFAANNLDHRWELDPAIPYLGADVAEVRKALRGLTELTGTGAH